MSPPLLPDDTALAGDLRPAQYHSLARGISECFDGESGLRIALLSSHSFEFLEPFLTVECARRGLATAMFSGAFGQIEQAILDSDAELWRQAPDVVVIGMRVEDVYPDAFLRASRDGGPGLAVQLATCIERLSECIEHIRDRSAATILIANFSLPQGADGLTLFDANSADGCTFTLADANRELASRTANIAGVEIWDYAGLVSARGAATWTDHRLWFLARQPFAAANLPFAAEHLARTIVATTRPRAKCLVLDLDNTLWGGVAGDDGLQGIELSDDFPGSVFKSFQRAVLGLRDSGILLAISSKNDEQTAQEIVESHPDMLLRWDDFVCTRVNWRAKSENLLEIADEIGIGIDSLVLFDDSPVERAEVRLNAPLVNVIDVPKKSTEFQDALFRCGYFDTVALTNEDSQRARQYQQEARRNTARKSVQSMHEFLVSLEMTVTIDDVSDKTIARTGQLVAKTNQFNLTTRRYAPLELQQMVDSADIDIRCIRLCDKFGDSGVVGVSIVRFDEGKAVIDSLIMSCRVMNRQVEHAMISDIEARSRLRKCSVLEGEYIATEKNRMIEKFFVERGFSENGINENTHSFTLDLSAAGNFLKWPDVLALE